MIKKSIIGIDISSPATLRRFESKNLTCDGVGLPDGWLCINAI